LRAPAGAEFITSDIPVIKAVQNQSGTTSTITGWQESGVWVTFPLSPSEMLICVTDRHINWAPEVVTRTLCDNLNKRTAHFAYRYVYARTCADYILPTMRCAVDAS
jgi:hypothetical protein